MWKSLPRSTIIQNNENKPKPTKVLVALGNELCDKLDDTFDAWLPLEDKEQAVDLTNMRCTTIGHFLCPTHTGKHVRCEVLQVALLSLCPEHGQSTRVAGSAALGEIKRRRRHFVRLGSVFFFFSKFEPLKTGRP
jgi:hypothetical protein